MLRLTGEGQTEKKRDVVFYLGPGVEFWDPTTPNKEGLGGSETAAIEMAKSLQNLGRKVTVYAEAQGIWDGVEYIHHSHFRGTDCEVFIASRTPWAIQRFGPVTAGLSLLWVHDIHCGPPNPELELSMWQFDRILCLSEWHKEFFLSVYKNIEPSRVLVTRNGIDPSRFRVVTPKTNRMVWSSSPNRGLVRLLAAVREIRKEIPDAAVDIFYGFNTWETMSKAYGDQAGLQEIARYRQEIERAETEGIAKFHGRRSQGELAQAFLGSKLWAYPTDFPETSCISAMEAQAAGCVPVATKFAALQETVKHGVLIDVKDMEQRFVSECVKALKGEYSDLATKARNHALDNLSWLNNAMDWLNLFASLKATVDADPIHRWVEAA
jgi:glycosyltransferase involved in cell wall biosynthesis